MSECKDKPTVGGQALIEGVMMRGAERIAWAVRKPDGEIAVESFPFVSVTKRVKVLGWPLVRGVVGLFESMRWGYRALTRSAELSMEAETTAAEGDSTTNMMPAINIGPEPAAHPQSSLIDKLLLGLTMVLAMAIGIGLFNFAPLWVSKLIGLEDTAVQFRLMAGAIRIVLILIYMWAISLWGETRRLFEYHGAEHKTILAYEEGKRLTCSEIAPYTTIHPRCGTSFIVLVAICGIFMASAIDIVYKHYTGDYASLPVRFALSLAFLPLLAGVSYEALKLSARFKDVPVVNFLILPGLLVQRITTKPPDDAQIEVAVKALEAVI